MIEVTISALLALVTIVSLVTLVDCWIRARYTMESIREERALLDAGFVPMALPGEQRLRQPMRFDALATAGRVPAQRLQAGRRGQVKQPPAQAPVAV